MSKVYKGHRPDEDAISIQLMFDVYYMMYVGLHNGTVRVYSWSSLLIESDWSKGTALIDEDATSINSSLPATYTENLYNYTYLWSWDRDTSVFVQDTFIVV